MEIKSNQERSEAVGAGIYHQEYADAEDEHGLISGNAENTEKLKAERIKSGKYIKNNSE